MAHLKYYLEERLVFSDANQKMLDTEQEISIVFKKLIRHFKVGKHKWSQPILKFGRKNCANESFVKVVIPTTFLILCHEVAHVKHIKKINHEKFLGEHKGKKIRYHGKKHFKIMKSMIRYCEKKNWFEAELARRIAPKPLKPEPTGQEKKSKELECLRLKISVWESKLKRAENKLKKLRRREKSIQSRIRTPQLPPDIDDKVNQGDDSRNPPHQVSIPSKINADKKNNPENAEIDFTAPV